MSDEAIWSGLTEIFREAFDDPAMVVTPELTADDVEDWDSNRMIELIVAAEQRFGVKLTTRELDRMTCVGDFAKAIAAKLPGRG